jgi:HEAT repeat protein
MVVLNLLDELLNRMHIETRSITAYFAAGILLTQLTVLSVLVLYVVRERLLRKFYRRDNFMRTTNYLLAIEAIMAEEDFSKQYSIALKLKKQMTSPQERGFLRRLILDALRGASGRKRAALLGLYRSVGFYARDEKLAKSLWWWKRLEAVIRFEKLHSAESVPLLESMIDDKHELVALGAIRALSTHSNPEKNIMLLEALSRRAPTRQDLFLGIFEKIGRADPGALLKYLNECYDPLHASFAVIALAHLNVRHALPVLQQLAKSSSDEVAASVAVALGIMKLERGEQTLEELLLHPEPRVRALSLLSLVPIQPSQRRTLENLQLREDPSPEVKRALFDIEIRLKGVG